MPEVSVTALINHKAHQKLGKTIYPHPSAVPISAFADTCAQTSTSGPSFLKSLNCSQYSLIRTRHRSCAVDNDSLHILGAAIVDFTYGKSHATEIVYICNKVNGLFLSQTALKKLGIIKPDFPQTSNVSAINSIDTDSHHPIILAECGCPRRSECPPIPDKLPFPATLEYREQLEQWIKHYFSSSAFNICPHQKLQAMSGEPFSITFNDEYTPVAIHKPIPVPHHWKLDVKAQLDQDVALGIIEPVPTGTPTTWCARMVTVPKADGTPRRTVDLQNLNDATKRETHHTESPFHVVNTIPTKTFKSKLDAWNGYHSIPLAKSARDATTFITEWGRFRYLRAPQGFHASNDAYTKRFDDITEGYPRVKRITDDSILWDTDIASSFWHIVNYIKLCADHGVVFNPDKFEFAKEIIEFASFTITPDGYKPSVKLMDAIRNFPSPTNITGIRSWFGLINQTSYAFASAPRMAPFRDLLKRNGKFYWDDTLELLFQESKNEIIRCLQEDVKTF